MLESADPLNIVVASYTIAVYIDYIIAIYTDSVIILRITSLSIMGKSLSVDNLDRINIILVDKGSCRRI